MKHYNDLHLLKRQWFPLWQLDMYILREFLIKYSILLSVFIMLFILNDVYRDMAAFLDAKVPLRNFIFYILHKLPGNICFVLPISMLLGCIWTMAAFGKNMEITAMRASGVSLSRCSLSIFAVGLIVTLVNVYFNESLVPYATPRAEELKESQTKGPDQRQIGHKVLAFRSDDGLRHWFFPTYVTDNIQKNVTVKTFWTESMIKQVFKPWNKEFFTKRLVVVLPNKSAKLLTLPQEKIESELNRILVGRKVVFYGVTAIFNPNDSSWRFKDSMCVSYDRNIGAKTSGSQGTSAIHQGVVVSELNFSSKEIPETPLDLANAVQDRDNLSVKMIYQVLKRNPGMSERMKCIYKSVFFYRIAFPWACFIAVFLGIPLATKNERTGSLLAIIRAVVMILFYIVIAQCFLLIGKSGYLSPVIAGLGPTICFLGASIWQIFYDKK